MLESRQFSEGDFKWIHELILMIIINVYFYSSDIWRTVSQVHDPRGQLSVRNRLETFLLD